MIVWQTENSWTGILFFWLFYSVGISSKHLNIWIHLCIIIFVFNLSGIWLHWPRQRWSNKKTGLEGDVCAVGYGDDVDVDDDDDDNSGDDNNDDGVDGSLSGKLNVKDEELDEMLNEGKGPINFTVFLSLFGEKLNGENLSHMFHRVSLYFRCSKSGCFWRPSRYRPWRYHPRCLQAFWS